jgi:hypothetical protein
MPPHLDLVYARLNSSASHYLRISSLGPALNLTKMETKHL